MNELKRIAGKDWARIDELVKDFRAAAKKERPDRNRLGETAQQASALELKYVPILNEEAAGKLPAKNLCLVSSVGTRIQPVLLGIAILRPKSIVFVHTKESGQQVREIKGSPVWKEFFLYNHPSTTEIQIDPLYTTKTYEQLAKVVKQGKKSNWVIDITGGKKVMGAALSAFGFWRRIPVVYLDSKEQMGIPEPFSERLARIDNPYDTYGDPLLKAAQEAFNGHQFSAAIQSLQELSETISLREPAHRISVAAELVEYYMLWDRFEHSNDDEDTAEKFYSKFEKAVAQYRRFGYVFLDEKALEANCAFMAGLKATYRHSKGSLVDEYRLADVFCNSRRRAAQRLFDDAVARLYRCTEMAATLMLRRIVPKFNPDKADWNALRKKFPDTDLDAVYVKKAKNSPHKVTGLPKTKLAGLSVQMSLIGTLSQAVRNDPKAIDQQRSAAKDADAVYSANDEASCGDDGLYRLRNRSILAHGTKPLDGKLYKDFIDLTAKICRLAVGTKRWKQLTTQATFLTIRLLK